MKTIIKVILVAAIVAMGITIVCLAVPDVGITVTSYLSSGWAIISTWAMENWLPLVVGVGGTSLFFVTGIKVWFKMVKWGNKQARDMSGYQNVPMTQLPQTVYPTPQPQPQQIQEPEKKSS